MAVAAADGWGSTSRRAGAAVALFLAVRVLGLIALDVILRLRHLGGLHHMLSRYDGQWYAGIADHGYGTTIVAHDGLHSDYAFFPLFPMLERALHAVSQLGFVDSGLVINWCASALAAAGICTVVERVTDCRVALATVALWAVYPYAIVLSMSYTEGLLCALAAWALFAVGTRRWWVAGVLAMLAGLARPTGAAVIAAVLVAALVAAVRRQQAWSRVAPALALPPLGLAAYLLYVAARRHDLMGYFHATDGWKRGWDDGRYFVHWVGDVVRHGGAETVGGILVIAAVLAICWSIRSGIRQGLPLEFTVLSVVFVAMTLGTSGYFGSRPRYLIAAFPLLVPLASALVNCPNRWRAPLTAAAVTVAAGCIVLGGYVLTTGAP